MYDLVVIGAGPAGSSAGRRAARRGLTVLVIDKELFPRFKPCAGAVSKRALASLDVTLPEALREKTISGLRLCFRGRSIETSSETPIAVTVTRSRFDTFLLEKAAEAGADIHTGERVTGIEEQGDRVLVRTDRSSYTARYAAIAEGAHSRLAGLPGRRNQGKALALSMAAQVDAEDADIDSRLPGLLEIHIDLVRMGYCWIFPHRGYYSVGLWGFRSHLPDPKGAMKRFLGREGFREPLRFRGHLIPTGNIRGAAARSRICAVGDAAGLVDPLTGEGIPSAIRSGQIAADIVADVVAAGRNGPFSHRYEAVCRREFFRNFACARGMARTAHRFPAFFFHLLADDDELYRRLLEAPSVQGTYCNYLVWMISRLHRPLWSYLRGTTGGS